MARLLLPASLTSLFSPLMMMHKPYCPKIMTKNLRGGARPGAWGPRAAKLRVVRVRDPSHDMDTRMQGQGSLPKKKKKKRLREIALV